LVSAASKITGVTNYLLSPSGLVNRASLLEEDLRRHRRVGRNSVFIDKTSSGPSYVVKPRPRLGHHGQIAR